MGWNDTGFKTRTAARGHAKGRHLDFKTGTWEPNSWMAKIPSQCCLCPFRIKAGQRVGSVFDMDKKPAHIGCLVRHLNAVQ